MTKFTIIPKRVKVLHITHGHMFYNEVYRTVIGKTLTIGKYYIAEISNTHGLNKGDKFIIKMKWLLD